MQTLFAFMNLAEQKNFRLPAIIPIVLYNCAGKWTVCRNFRNILSAHEIFGENTVDFKYFLLDVNRYSEEKLLNISNVVSAVFLLDRKDVQDEGKLVERLRKMLDTLKKLDSQELLLFKAWAKGILTSLYPEKAEEIKNVLDEENEEVDVMVYNLEVNLKKSIEAKEQKAKKEGKIVTFFTSVFTDGDLKTNA